MNCSSIVELAEHIVELKNMGISVCIFMGAGVSSSAGVPSANTIMKDIEEKYPYAVKRAQKNRTYGEYTRQNIASRRTPVSRASKSTAS